MASLRQIVMLLVIHDIYLQVVWIPIKNNILADILLRFQFQKIANIYSQLSHLRL